MILYGFFVHILLLYQISTYTSLCTRIFNLSHFCDFLIPFVYQNSHIPTTYQSFYCILICENPFFVFCHSQTFSWRYYKFLNYFTLFMIVKWCLLKTENIEHRNSMIFIFKFFIIFFILLTHINIITPTILFLLHY